MTSAHKSLCFYMLTATVWDTDLGEAALEAERRLRLKQVVAGVTVDREAFMSTELNGGWMVTAHARITGSMGE